MKKLFSNLCLPVFLSLLLLMQFSCQKESLLDQETSSEITSYEASLRHDNKKGNCSVDFEEMDITITWAEDCSTASITFALCCNCTFPFPFSTKTGCTIPGGVLGINVEECPFDIYSYEINVPNVSIPQNTCIPLTLEIENRGCGAAFIHRLWFNGEELEVDRDYSDVFCP